MCGIHGFTFESAPLIEQMVERAHHRGPDGSSTLVHSGISLGHNLLAITETPERSQQPWVAQSGLGTLLFNGEVYNHRLLGEYLGSKGVALRSECDTEVVCEGLDAFGISFLEQLDGMFALAWIDHRNRTLLLARDRHGTKPLYYAEHKGVLIFSSEIASLLTHALPRSLHPLAFQLYLEFGYVPGPLTLLEGIRKITPGEYREFALNKRSWDKVGSLQRLPKPIHEPFDAQLYRQYANQAVKKTLSGRRSIGLYLSGGLDSSIMLHEASQCTSHIRTFTTRFEVPAKKEQRYNSDADVARTLSDTYGTTHHELLITESDFIAAIEPSFEALEEPRYNRSSPAYYLMAKEVASKRVVVALMGEGGDELMAGYPSVYERIVRFQRFLPWLPRPVAGAITTWAACLRGEFSWRLPLSSLSDPVARWYYATAFRPHERWRAFNVNYQGRSLMSYVRGWVPNHACSGDILNDQMYLESVAWLAEDCLIRDDKLGMHFGIESRFPFLTRDIVEYSRGLPSSMKYSGNSYKVLPRLAYQDILPPQVLQKGKSGWAAPVEEWYWRSRLKSALAEYLSESFYFPTSKLFNFPLLRSEKSLKSIFTVISFQSWARRLGVVVPFSR